MIHLEILEQKWSYLFYLLDINKDGVLEEDDFMIVLDRLISNGDRRLGNNESRFLRSQVTRMFDTLYLECHLRGEKKIELSDWVKMLARNHKSRNSKFLRSFMYASLRYIFDYFDRNKDGVIDFQEFKNLFSVYGIDEGQVYLSFRRVDTNGDGLLSRSELKKALNTFFFKNEPSDLNYLFGEFHQPNHSYLHRLVSSLQV